MRRSMLACAAGAALTLGGAACTVTTDDAPREGETLETPTNGETTDDGLTDEPTDEATDGDGDGDGGNSGTG
jgi:hypothetical protein